MYFQLDSLIISGPLSVTDNLPYKLPGVDGGRDLGFRPNENQIFDEQLCGSAVAARGASTYARQGCYHRPLAAWVAGSGLPQGTKGRSADEYPRPTAGAVRTGPLGPGTGPRVDPAAAPARSPIGSLGAVVWYPARHGDPWRRRREGGE